MGHLFIYETVILLGYLLLINFRNYYYAIVYSTNSCEPELAHRLQTSKMRRNSTSLNSCQHDDINIVTVSVARRR